MRHFIYLTFFCSCLCSSTTLSAQEQVSFEYGNYRFWQYSVVNYYQHQDQLRLVTAEDNGEVLIFSIEGNQKDTLALINESETDIPYRQEANDKYLIQLFTDKVVVVDLETFAVNTESLSTTDFFNIIKIWEDYIIYFGTGDETAHIINLDDFSTYEVPSIFFNQADEEHLYGVVLKDTVRSLLTLNVETNQVDTVYEGTGNIYVNPKANSLILSNNNETFHYNIATKTLSYLYTINPANDGRYFFYKEELLFVENIDTNGYLTVMALDGSDRQDYILQDTFPRLLYEVSFKDTQGDFIFSDYSRATYRTNDLDQVLPLTTAASAGATFFSETSDDVLYLVINDVFQYYDPIADTFTIIDTIFDANSNYPIYEDLYQINGQWYLEFNENVHVDYDQTGGMKKYIPMFYRPGGLSDQVAFLQTSNDLYVKSRDDLYRFDGARFELMDSLSLQSDAFKFNDEIYSRARLNGSFKTIVIKEGGIVEPSTFDGQIIARTYNNQYLLGEDRVSFEYTYSAIDAAQGTDFYKLDFMPEDVRLFPIGVSHESTIYLRSLDEGVTTVWALNLGTNTIDSLFQTASIQLGYNVGEKIVLVGNNADFARQLYFVDTETNAVEIFNPPSIGEYHLSVFNVRCDNSLLLEIATEDCSYASIWSTDGTLVNTVLHIDNSIPVDRNFNDFGIHSDEQGIYFSIRTGDNIYDHYEYDCAAQMVNLESYPDDRVIGRRFKAGGTSFGVVLKDVVNGHALVDLTDPTNLVEVAALGKYRKNYESGYSFNVSEGLPYGDSTRQLAVLSIDPLGQEMYYVYADGTLELLTDINPGIADAFLVSELVQYRASGPTRMTTFQGNLFFDAHNRETGHQIYSMPVETLVSVDPELEDLPIQIKLYPNPAVDEIQLSTDQMTNFNWTIITRDGQLLRRGVGEQQEMSLDVSALTAGLHYLLVEINNRTFVKAFVKL